MSTITLYQGDCLEVLPMLPDDSVDLVLADPPYNGVKDADWDNQWASDIDYLQWLDRVLEQFKRVLRFNGSLYLFASPQMAARVEVLVSGRFNVLNAITWIKDNGWHKKAEQKILRAYFPQTERIVFAEHYNSDNYAKGEAGYGCKCDELRGFVFEPLRAYLANEWERAGLTRADADKATNSFMSGHYLSQVQWALPTREKYHQLRDYANTHNHGGDYLRREYEDLRREYEDLRREYEDLRRPFSVTAQVPYTDVWDFATVQAYPGKHPCEKPAALLEHIIAASSRPGAVVLDAFMGSGATCMAARKLGRACIGIDADPHWFAYAQRRLETTPEQLPLLEGA